MLAEIDTGGPRVLHCDYRADCPIPIELVSTESSLNRDNRVVRTPIVRRLPRSDEKGTATLDDGFVVESRGWFGFFPRRVESASRFIGVRRADETLEEASLQTIRCVDSDYHRNASCPTRPESRPRDTDDRSTLDGATITTGTRTDDRSLEQETSRRLGSSGIPSRIRKNEHEENERDDNRDRRGSWCSKRCVLSTRARNWPRFRVADHVRIGRAARFSSQSSDPSTRYEELVSRSTVASSLADETWKEVDVTNSRSRCESRVAKVVPSIDLRRRTDFPRSRERDGTLTSGDRRTRKKKKKKRREYAYANGRRSTYIQLALLLFLVAFGQCGLHKPSVFNHSAKTSTTGLSVLAIGTVISAVSAAPVDLMGDAGVRAERSANLSHITGASRKIQMYIKNRHLQILPDGTVNGSNDDTSDYTIFQRMSVSRGQLRIQGVATCLYLCMDSCGLLYGSREYTDDCVFNETLEQHNYNTYSSAKWSTAKKTLYLGLNRRGQPRRVQAKGHNLGRLSAYARVLTQVAPLDRVEALQRRLLGAKHNVRHRHNSHRGDLLQQSLCPTLPAQEKDGRDKFRCRKRKKRKKRKRKCRPGEKPGPQCQTTEDGNGGPLVPVGNEGPGTNGTSPESKRSCEGAASEEACRREALSVPSKKRKLRVEEEAAGGDGTSAAGRRNVTASSSNEEKEEGAVSEEEPGSGTSAPEEVHAWPSGQHVCGAHGNLRTDLRNVLLFLVVSWCVNRPFRERRLA
ncbi:uncharacterized protein LOC108628914 isoform X2 [Ceratina calcarata]|uniref:Fibroblast growth factor n=1 Tax=Ceratina calcarata TaxID=156304 RepID=A0AAJ7S7B4_9HYME|nr:uncharacterized protein LOC108628914 isoform X2 [Ceratina calcarata]